MGRRNWFTLALIMGLCVLSATGCRKRGSRRTTINQGSSIFTTDNFPGSSVQDGNVADDQRAMSPAGDSVVDVEVFFNGDRDIAMVVYEYTSAGTSFGGGTSLYVNYYEGGHFHPPVHLSRAVDLVGPPQIDSSFGANFAYLVDDVTVAWVNTDDHDDENAEERSGDALIFWRGRDFASGGTDGNNDSLYYNYFDVDRHESAGHNYGFLDFSLRISSQDESDEHVTTHGLVSDGLCGEARWSGDDFYNNSFGNIGRRYQWGDPTTQIILFWRERFDNGATLDDDETFWVRFPLDQAGPTEDPLLPTAVDSLGLQALGASNSGADSEETRVDQTYITYNLTIWQRVSALDGGDGEFVDYPGTPNADTDITIQESTFLTTDFSSPVLMHTSTPDVIDGDENCADFIQQFGFLDGHCVYGPDEGILEIVFFHHQLEEELSGGYTAVNSGELVLNQIDPATGGTSQIVLTSDDVDILDDIGQRDFDVVMSRNGDYLFFAWQQVVDSGGSDDIGLWAGHYRTSRDPEVPVLGVVAATSSPFNVSPDVDGDPVNVFEFQNQLGYVCGQQSDAEVMNLFYEQSDGGYDELNVIRLTADLVSASAAFTFTDTLVTTDDDDSLISDGDYGVGGGIYETTDSGEGGNFFVAFFRDIDITVFSGFQLHGLRTGAVSGSGRIDSNEDFRTLSSSITMAGTPLKDEIEVFDVDGNNDDDRASPNALITVIFDESETTESFSNTAIRTRTVHTDTEDSLTFSTMFTPDLTLAPFQLSRPMTSTTDDPFVIDLLIGDGGLALFFHQEDHAYYQAQDDGAGVGEVGWLLADSDDDDAPPATNPILVDDDDQDPATLETVFAKSCTCDEAHGAFIMWFKALDSGPTRLQGRVLNPDSD